MYKKNYKTMGRLNESGNCWASSTCAQWNESNYSCITSSEGAEARSSAGAGHTIELPQRLSFIGAVKSSCKRLRAPRVSCSGEFTVQHSVKTGALTECWHMQLLFHTEEEVIRSRYIYIVQIRMLLASNIFLEVEKTLSTDTSDF